MKLEKYKVERLENPEGNITHKLVYESISKNKGSGGFGYGIRHKGTYRECLEMKKEIERCLFYTEKKKIQSAQCRFPLTLTTAFRLSAQRKTLRLPADVFISKW